MHSSSMTDTGNAYFTPECRVIVGRGGGTGEGEKGRGEGLGRGRGTGKGKCY